MLSKNPSDTIENIEVNNEELKFGYAFRDEFAQKNSQLNNLNLSVSELLSAQRNEATEDVKRYQNPRTLERLADIYFLKKNYTRAKKYYIKAINLDKNLLAIYEKIILIYLIENKLDEADKYHKLILKITERRTDYLHKYILFKVSLMDSEESMSEAFENISEIIKKTPNDSTALNTYGFLYLKKNDFESAKKYFEKALEINPEYAFALNNIGVCCAHLEDVNGAIKFYNKAIDIMPKYQTPYENLANCYTSIGCFRDALLILEKAVNENVPISEIWQHHIGWLYIKISDYEKAIAWYENRIIIEQKNGLLFNNLGHCYLQMGRIDEGRKYIKKAVNLFEEGVKKNKQYDIRGLISFYNLGRIALKDGDKDEVNSICEKILHYSKDDAFADYLKGTGKVAERDYASAKSFFLNALNKRKDIPEVYSDLSFIFVGIEEDYQTAIELLENAISLGFNQLLIVNNLIYAYIENNNLDKAEKLLDKFQGDIPSIIYTNKALFSFRNNDLKKGDLYYKKAFEMLPESSAKIARQYWYIEKCKYYINKGDKIGAEKYLNLIDKKDGVYLDSRIDRLNDKFKSVFL